MVQTAILAIQVYVDCVLPVFFCDLIHSGSGARDSGAINQDIEAVKSGTLNLEKRRDLRFIGDIGVSCLAGRDALPEYGQSSVVDIADVDFSPRFRECGCNGGADSGGAGSYQNPQSAWGIESISEGHS
jgi:hypothetical protein